MAFPSRTDMKSPLSAPPDPVPPGAERLAALEQLRAEAVRADRPALLHAIALLVKLEETSLRSPTQQAGPATRRWPFALARR